MCRTRKTCGVGRAAQNSADRSLRRGGPASKPRLDARNQFVGSQVAVAVACFLGCQNRGRQRGARLLRTLQQADAGPHHLGQQRRGLADPGFRLSETRAVLWLQVRKRLLTPGEARDALGLLRAPSWNRRPRQILARTKRRSRLASRSIGLSTTRCTSHSPSPWGRISWRWLMACSSAACGNIRTRSSPACGCRSTTGRHRAGSQAGDRV